MVAKAPFKPVACSPVGIDVSASDTAELELVRFATVACKAPVLQVLDSSACHFKLP